MKNFLLIVIPLLISSAVMAQYPGAGGGSMKSVPSIGHLYGKVVDESGKSIGDASLLLLQNRYDTATKKKKEVLLKGSLTASNGEFSFEDLPIFGQLILRISASGFKNYEQSISFMPKGTGNAPGASAQAGSGAAGMMPNTDKDLGNIKLGTDVQQLQGVTITATNPLVKMDIDKKTFNVDKNIVTAGGTGLDVMKNVPSVQVDIDGNVKLRNAAPQLFVDGRPTTLTLDQIPADAIESVEVITNPSAKYDASGGNAGILNIVLKKNRKTGYNGNLRAGVDSRGGVNGGGDFNVRQGKINASASGMINQRKGITNGVADQTNLYETPVQYIHQDDKNKENGAFVFGKVGLDYFVTNKTTLSLNGVKVHGEFKPTDNINSDLTTGNVKSYATRNSNSTRSFNANGLQFGVKHLLAKEGAYITADGNYFAGKNSGNALYLTDSMDAAHSIYATQQQNIISSGNNKFLTLQTDYSNPLNGTTKIEAGLRASIKSISSDNETSVNDNSTGFVKVPSAASDYTNRDNVYAAYATFTSAIKKFGYQAGLRAESSDYTGTVITSGDKFKNTYPVSLFPSVFLSQKLKADQELQLNYSRRINRPNFFQFIPYTDRTDPLNITRGNPDLVPEFTNSLEASYSKNFSKQNNLLASVYFKNTNNLITRYQQKEYDVVLEKDVLVNTYINANSSYSYGAEITGVNYINKWWDITSNINVYNSRINTDNVTGTSQDALWSWFGKLNNNFKLPKSFTIQLSANYQSKTNLPINNSQGGPGGGGPFGQTQSASQGYIKSFYGVDIAIKKTFLKNNAASATLSFSDIFRSRTQEQYSESEYFIQDYSRLRDPQLVRLNLSYRFGKADISLFKRKNMNTSGLQGATEGMGQ